MATCENCGKPIGLIHRCRPWLDAERIERARVRGEEMSAALRAGESLCLRGCLCARCGGDPTKQQPTDGANPDKAKVRTQTPKVIE